MPINELCVNIKLLYFYFSFVQRCLFTGWPIVCIYSLPSEAHRQRIDWHYFFYSNHIQFQIDRVWRRNRSERREEKKIIFNFVQCTLVLLKPSVVIVPVLPLHRNVFVHFLLFSLLPLFVSLKTKTKCFNLQFLMKINPDEDKIFDIWSNLSLSPIRYKDNWKLKNGYYPLYEWKSMGNCAASIECKLWNTWIVTVVVESHNRIFKV